MRAWVRACAFMYRCVRCVAVVCRRWVVLGGVAAGGAVVGHTSFPMGGRCGIPLLLWCAGAASV